MKRKQQECELKQNRLLIIKETNYKAYIKELKLNNKGITYKRLT